VWAAAFLAKAAELRPVDDGTSWPSKKYQRDPIGFFRDVLGWKPSAKQAEIAEKVRDNLRVAVHSNNKAGKTTLAAALAIWFFCSFPDARVRITAVKAEQINAGVWREIRRLCKNAKVTINVRPPAWHAGTGMHADDGREIVGFSSDSKEGAQGISGGNLFYIVDEASGLPDEIYEAIQGNRAGGNARLFCISNPTRCEGWFYEACRSSKLASLWQVVHLCAYDSPNFNGGHVPGLASPAWVEEMKIEHGEDSVFFKQRVLGQFTEGEEGKIISLHAIVTGQKAWATASEDGPLVIGLDPAGPGQGGDDTVFAPLRGFKCYNVHGHRGLTSQGILTHLEGYIGEYARDGRDIAIVAVDRAGAVGNEVYGILRAAAQQPRAQFRVVGVASGQRATRLPHVYELIRDELWACCAQWLKDGGGIPEHHKLERDLHAPAWERSIRDRDKATHKDEIRKALGRSPDYGDALCLAVWCRNMDPNASGGGPDGAGGRRVTTAQDARRIAGSDPYSGGSGFDPYGGG